MRATYNVSYHLAGQHHNSCGSGGNPDTDIYLTFTRYKKIKSETYLYMCHIILILIQCLGLKCLEMCRGSRDENATKVLPVHLFHVIRKD